MTATITATNGAGSTTPVSILSPWATSWRSRNVIHDVVGGGLVVSLVAPRPRAGTFEAFYNTEAEAFACIALHEVETSFVLNETDLPNVGMTYVIDGVLDARLDPDTLELWIVTIGYQAVIP